MTGDAWWAIVPALGALGIGGWWIAHRRTRPNEPRFEGGWILLIAGFHGFLVLPIWRGIRRDDVAGFPEAFFLGGFASAAALLFYILLIIRR